MRGANKTRSDCWSAFFWVGHFAHRTGHCRTGGDSSGVSRFVCCCPVPHPLYSLDLEYFSWTPLTGRLHIMGPQRPILDTPMDSAAVAKVGQGDCRTNNLWWTTTFVGLYELAPYCLISDSPGPIQAVSMRSSAPKVTSHVKKRIGPPQHSDKRVSFFHHSDPRDKTDIYYNVLRKKHVYLFSFCGGHNAISIRWCHRKKSAISAKRNPC